MLHDIFYLFIFCAVLNTPVDGITLRRQVEPNDIVNLGTDMQEAYTGSALEQANDSFQGGVLTDVINAEKRKTQSCQQMVERAMERNEDEYTANKESEKDCDILVAQSLEQIEDKSEIQRLKSEMMDKCKKMIENAMRTKKTETEDIFGDAVHSVSDATAQSKIISISACTRDYSRMCPTGWTDVGDNQTCEAPASYSGPCATLVIIPTSSKKKTDFESRCHVRWPCLEQCEYDYKSICPESWENIGGGKCRAPSTYSGHCERIYHFQTLTVANKKQWAAACDVSWPCRREVDCERDYDVNCPAYSGNCGSQQSVAAYDKALKAIFEKKCGVVYPCKDECERDFSIVSVCPANWYLWQQNGKCYPPDSYVGPCEATNLSTYTVTEKKKFGTDCRVKWPCIEECSRDYTAFCPMEWRRQGDYCIAPDVYAGSCEKRKSFTAYTEDMKKATQKNCQVHWPCEGEQASQPMILGSGTSRGAPLFKVPMQTRRITGHGPVDSITGNIAIVNA